MPDWMNAALDGALRVADILEDWITETVCGFGAAAPVVPGTEGHAQDIGTPGKR